MELSSAPETCPPDPCGSWGHYLTPTGGHAARRREAEAWLSLLLPQAAPTMMTQGHRFLIHSGLAERTGEGRRGQGRAGHAQIQGADTDRGHCRGIAIPFLSVSVAWTSRMSPDPPRTSGPSSPCKDSAAGEAHFRATAGMARRRCCARDRRSLSLRRDQCGHAAEARHAHPLPAPLGDKQRVELIWEVDGREAAQTPSAWGTLL